MVSTMGIKLIAFFLPLLCGWWMATQKLAALLMYDGILGRPTFFYMGEPYYGPWNYLVWLWNLHAYIPDIFKKTYIYLYGGLLVGVLLLFFLQKKALRTSHGSAHWGTYNDIVDMDLISASGVVVGLYDSSWKRACTKLLRKVEAIKKEKLAYAELDFERKQEKKVDHYHTILPRLDEALEKEDEAKKKIFLLQKKKIEHFLSHRPRYDARREDPWSVYPYVWLHKRMQGILAHQKHFYLRDNSNKHLAVIAPTRSGKGVGLIIPTLLGSWKESVIVNDIKSENWGITAGYRKRMGQIVIKFEPTAEDGSSARWNPLEEIPIGTQGEVAAAQNLAYILANYEGKEKLDHWGANAALVITTVILHLIYAHYADPKNYPYFPSLYTVAAFMKSNIVPKIDEEGRPVRKTVNGVLVDEVDTKGFLDTLKSLKKFEHVPKNGIKIREWDKEKHQYAARHFDADSLRQIYPQAQSLEKMPYTHPIIYQNFVEILAKPDNECGSIISTANTALKEYLDPTLAMNTVCSDFCIDDVMNEKKPMSLYLVTPPSDLLRLAPIFRLFFEMMVKHHAKSLGTYKKGRAKALYKHKCLFLMDEFSSLGNLQSFAATLSYIAGYGMKVFLINQGLPQINGIYGKDNQILMNCHLQIIYAPNDNDTGKYAESLIGQQTIEVESTSSRGLWGLQDKNYTQSETGRALITADEIKRLGDEEIIVPSGAPPIKTDKVKYYEDNYFLKKLMDAPLVSDVIRKQPNPMRENLLRKQKRQKKIAALRKKIFHYVPPKESLSTD